MIFEGGVILFSYSYFQVSNKILHPSTSFFFAACPYSKYGGNCSETCGNCFKNLTCNHIDGTCINGCQKGFRGQFCRSSKSVASYKSMCECVH